MNSASHLFLRSKGMASSHPTVALMVPLSRTLDLMRITDKFPEISKMLALLLATILLVSLMGVNSSSFLNSSAGENPLLSKIFTLLLNLPLVFDPKCNLGIFVSIVSRTENHLSPPMSKLAESLETLSEGTSPLTVQALAFILTMANVSSACSISL